MPIVYSIEKVIEDVEKALKIPKKLYAVKVVDYKGKSDGERSSEVIAKYLLDNLVKWEKKIPMITRERSYYIKRKGVASTGRTKANSTQEEKHIVMDMFKKTRNEGYIFPFLGKILNYEVPLNKKGERGEGRIDFISQCSDSSVILVEFKTSDNKESLLRAVLEIYTYSQTVDSAKLLEDFNLPKNTKIRKAVLLGRNSKAHRQYTTGEYLYLLMQKLGIEIFVYDVEKQKVTLP